MTTPLFACLNHLKIPRIQILFKPFKNCPVACIK
jgi:hypothetical protein